VIPNGVVKEWAHAPGLSLWDDFIDQLYLSSFLIIIPHQPPLYLISFNHLSSIISKSQIISQISFSHSKLVTSARYSPDGSMVVCGLFQGQVFFYQSEVLKKKEERIFDFIKMIDLFLFFYLSFCHIYDILYIINFTIYLSFFFIFL